MLDKLANIVETHYADVVTYHQFLHRHAGIREKLRLYIRDTTFVDIWVNPAGTRYSFHWEQRAKRGLIHRYDNAPDFPNMATFPKHFHNGSDSQVEESYLSDNLQTAFRQFMSFVRSKLAELGV